LLYIPGKGIPGLMGIGLSGYLLFDHSPSLQQKTDLRYFHYKRINLDLQRQSFSRLTEKYVQLQRPLFLGLILLMERLYVRGRQVSIGFLPVCLFFSFVSFLWRRAATIDFCYVILFNKTNAF
jgi:hypothetical protein